ncbi:YncE family protein [Pseudonocardia lutea]|uniref:YncE family protein n=1 Tax=Pseudonocardia lutea TaxID=2172015 RepID=A0ABW1ICT9_9PSEU
MRADAHRAANDRAPAGRRATSSERLDDAALRRRAVLWAAVVLPPAGSVGVLDAYTGVSSTKWRIPGGSSPDRGDVSADGSQLWLSGRSDRAVNVLSTTDVSPIRTIDVGNGPHGLSVWPQPGRYSLGHPGIGR